MNMKKIRITWNGEHLRDVYAHATKWQIIKFRLRRFFHKVLIVIATAMAVSFVGLVSFAFGSQMGQVNVIAVPAQDMLPPVLQRIEQCESNGSQLDRNGQVLLHWNDNHSVDVGIFAINEQIWGKMATKMGYDLTVKADNIAFAKFLYANYGTAPWLPSSRCWSR